MKESEVLCTDFTALVSVLRTDTKLRILSPVQKILWLKILLSSTVRYLFSPTFVFRRGRGGGGGGGQSQDHYACVSPVSTTETTLPIFTKFGTDIDIHQPNTDFLQSVVTKWQIH
jgi:hypothetical protein